MKRKFFAAFLSLCMVMSLVPMTALAAEGDTVDVTSEDTLLSSIGNADNGTTIRLTASFSVSQQITIPVGKELTLDLNGQTLETSNTILVNGNLTVMDATAMDATATVSPSISNDYETVTYDAGKIYNNKAARDPGAVVITVRDGGRLTHNSGTLESSKNYTVAVYGETRTANWNTPIDSTAVINGGYHVGQEGGPAVFGNGATLDISGGVIVGEDNSAVAGNGTRSNTENCGGTTINITGGTLIGHITSPKYIACGIYHPQEGALNISGGTIYADGGVGILMRAGNANITGGTIISTGTTPGKVGDNDAPVSCSGVVYDASADYPGASESDKVSISGNTNITSENKVPAVTVMNNGGSNNKYMEIVGGSFSSDVKEYFPDGAILKQENGKVIPDTSQEESAFAKVNGVPYTSLQSAINMARDGDTVTLLKDETLDATITVDKTVTIDLNQHTVAGNAVRAFHVINGTMTLTGTGTVTSTEMQDPNSSVIRVGNNGTTGTTGTTPAGLVVEENVVIEAPGTYGISVFGNATKETLTVNGTVTATGPAPAISGNGMYDGTAITIGETAKISASESVAIYHPQDGMLTIKGGIITGGIEAKSGTITINGNPSISAVGKKDHTANGNGPSTTGYAIAIVDNSAYGNGATITISSGSYNGPVEYLEDGNGVGSENESGSITVCGGHFSAPVSKEYLANTINAELYSLRNTEAPYSYYSSVGAAQAAAQPGDVVTDLSDVDPSTTTRYDVVLHHGNGTTQTLSVYDGATITLPTLSNRGYNHFVGWTDQAGKHYDGGDTVTITANTIFTAVWNYIPPANPNYRIDIPAAEGGTVTADPPAAKAGATVTLTATPDEGYAVGTITVTDRFGDAVKVTENADGTYTFTMPNGQVTVKATFVETEEPVAEPFIDVAEGDWFYDAVVYAYQNELMDGVGGNRFAPNSETTRAQLVTILYRLEGEPAVSGDLPFTDVEAGIWYTDAILWAAQNNIVNGVSDTEFAPGDDLTRQQLVTILYRYAEAKGYDVSASADLSGYPDAGQVQDYAQPAMAWAVAENIIQGMEDGTLKPAGNASRAQIATILMRFCEDVAQ